MIFFVVGQFQGLSNFETTHTKLGVRTTVAISQLSLTESHTFRLCDILLITNIIFFPSID